ncbi:MAG: hypothetical protein ACYDDB_00930 [bacterium]
MKSLKSLAIQTFLSIFAAALIVPVFSGTSFAKFYCPLGYSYNPDVQLCIGKGALKGYNTIPATKINVFKGKNHTYICPNKYTYSKKIQLCKGEGSLKGYTSQPTVKTIISLNTAKKSVKKSKNVLKKGIKNSKNIKKS